MEKSDKRTIFEYYRNIVKKEGKLSKEEVDSDFDIIGMNKLFSYDKMNVLLANEINDFLLNKYTVYLYYYFGVDKRKYVPFLNMKKEINEEKERVVELARFLFPEYSILKINEVAIILKKVLSDIKIEEINNTGGIEKEKRR